MANFTQLTNNLGIISALSDTPSETSTQLKAKFDEAAGIIKTYLNGTLISELEAQGASAKVGAVVGGVASNLQAFINAVETAGTGNLPPAGSVTNSMMATDVKIGSLASLTTSNKSSVQSAINELVTSISNISPGVGKIEYTATRNALTGYLKCDGSAVSRSTYANLFNTICPTSTFTVTIASPAVFTSNAHGLNVGDILRFTTTGALPTITRTATQKTVTANGNAQISTAQSKFGGASAYFDGTGDYLSIPDSDDWNYGSGDFTIECWIRTTSIGTVQEIISQIDSGGYKPVYFAINSAGKIVLYASSNGTSYDIANGTASTSTLSTNTWYHIALVRNSNLFKVYLNGIEEISVTSSSSLFNADGTLRIGSGNGGNYFIGYIDEIRISKGIARWTSAFTPSTLEYPADNQTVLLLHCNGANASTTFTDENNVSFTDINFYVISSGYGANSFQVATSAGGSAINTSGTQSGTHSYRIFNYGAGDGSTTFNLPTIAGSTIACIKY